MGCNRAGEKQEHANQGQFKTDKAKPLVNDHAKDDKAGTSRINHANSMNPAIDVGQLDQAETADQKRNHANRNRQSGQHKHKHIHHSALVGLSPSDPVLKIFKTAKVPMKFKIA